MLKIMSADIIDTGLVNVKDVIANVYELGIVYGFGNAPCFDLSCVICTTKE